jgi:hypothetical protein
MAEILEKKKFSKKFTKKFYQCEQNHGQCENRLKDDSEKLNISVYFVQNLQIR